VPIERATYLRIDDRVELLDAEFERFAYERHWHDTYAIGVTVRGVQRFRCGGRTYDSVAGKVIVIPPGEVHDGESGAAGGYAYRMFYVAEDTLYDLVSDALERRTRAIAPQACLLTDPDLARRLARLWRVMHADARSLAAEELFQRAFADLWGRTLVDRDAARVLPDARLDRVRDYLHEHLHQHASLAQLAALTSMSRYRLTRQFERAFGLPLHAYHVQVRLQEAKRRIGQGVPLARVAIELGFADQSHFHRRFKGAFGITPGECRASKARRPNRTTIQEPYSAMNYNE